ncbi:MAG: hypothetical protein K0Q64_2037, partial [Nitrobacter vulgaris]|nr:hypothetical protein [Nitrobacter vulgaris]
MRNRAFIVQKYHRMPVSPVHSLTYKMDG